jgi:hypothetical protein
MIREQIWRKATFFLTVAREREREERGERRERERERERGPHTEAFRSSTPERKAYAATHISLSLSLLCPLFSFLWLCFQIEKSFSRSSQSRKRNGKQ